MADNRPIPQHKKLAGMKNGGRVPPKSGGKKAPPKGAKCS